MEITVSVRLLGVLLALPLTLLPTLVASGCGDRPSPPAPADAPTPYDLEGAPRGSPPTAGPRPNVILVVLDTLRADALDLTGARSVMPLLRERARRGVAFADASAPAPWTQPSMSSLLTGVLPSRHGVTGEDLLAFRMRPLTTWAEILGRALGYATVAWVGGPWLNAPGQLLEGFQQVVPRVALPGVEPLIDRFAAAREPARPFFLLLHSFEVHDPYGEANHPYPPLPPVLDPALDPVAALGAEVSDAELARRSILDRTFHAYLWRTPAHAALQERVIRYQWDGLARAPDPVLAQELRAAYDGGARWVDGLLDRALRQMERAGLLANTLLIVTADHGEAFGEHGQLLHGRQLYDELLRIPMVAVGPAPFAGGRVVHGSVSLMDLFPTCLALVRAPPPGPLDGTSLLPLLEQGGPGRPVFAEEARTPRRTGGAPAAQLVSVRSTAWKAVLTQQQADGTVREELYDLVADPGETRDLAAPAGRIGATPLEVEFARCLEQARDRFWSASGAPGAGGTAAGPRPPAPVVRSER